MRFKKNKPSQSAKDLGSPPRVIFSVLLIYLGSQFIAFFIVELFLSLSSGRNLDSSTLGQFFYILLAEAMAGGSAIWLVRRRRLGLGHIGLGRRPGLADLAPAVAGFFAFYILLIVVSLVSGWLIPGINKGSQDVGFNNLGGGFGQMLAFISLVMIPPLGEEPLVRGYLYSGLRARYKFVPAMLMTSLLFGAAHLLTGYSGLLWAAALNTFILSLVLVYLRERTGALYAGMLVHLLNNLIAFGFHFHGVIF
jgi:membrane protease YdiL (CAAX protease family)